ncbi:DNA replication and repair protein RecR [Mycoplasmopsis mustelae]|uniref:Recombination protein RecR n=1 Tax=Mycoplasmopsis mustelae TaxID=171289 RepID=A0A4R7UDY7_9BACT|nr:recombination protein RecR [Mycoplasmopsis mustelae]TDV23562.1 DNA replication and repair protein RecR [Mycoplasmopsis mustelae]
MFESEDINNLIQKLKKIPGFSKKSSEKFVYWIFDNEQISVNLLVNDIKKIKENTKFCNNCTNILDKKLECKICNDETRKNTLLVLENLSILDKIEKSGFYFGRYFIFNKQIESEYDYKNNLAYINDFLNYAKGFEEIILGISPTLKGEILINILKKALKNLKLKVSQIAIGVPLGASVDYIDETTLKFSIKNRQKD